MLSYCLKCRKNTESKTPKIVWTKNGSIMLLSKYSVCNSKKSRLIKEQELIELLSSLLIKPALIKFFYWLLFCFKSIQQVNARYKMNEMVNKFLLAGNKFVPFTKNKERIQTLKETGDSRYIYQNKLGKACFQHDMAYGYFKDLNRRTAADKYYVIKHLISPKIQNMMDINLDLLQWYIKFLITKFPVKQLQLKIFLIKN